MTANRRGTTLLEAILAIALIATLGLTVLRLSRAARDAVSAAERSDLEMRAASDFLNAVSLWSQPELDQRLGFREQGRWTLEIARPEVGFYEVRLLDSAATSIVLETSLFRRPALVEAP